MRTPFCTYGPKVAVLGPVVIALSIVVLSHFIT